MISDFGIDYTLKPRVGSSVTLGEYTNVAMTVKIKRGYFGASIKDCRNLNNTTIYFKIDFADGCSTGFSIKPDYSKKTWYKDVEAILHNIAEDINFYTEHITRRAKAFKQMEPLQKITSASAKSMFDRVESYGGVD